MTSAPLCIFLHIPRTGGTTLNTIFFSNFAKEEIISLYSREDFAEGAARLAREKSGEGEAVKLVQGHFLHDDRMEELRQGREAALVTFIRHPVERLVSEYLFLKSWPHSQMHALIRDRNVSFADYITSNDQAFRYRTKNLMTRIFSRLPFEDEVPEEAHKLALANARQYALVGITEHFDAGLLLLGDLLGLSNIFYERQNRVAPALKETISDTDKALAAEYNAADIRLYEALRAEFEEKTAALGDPFAKRLADFQLVNGKFNKVADLISRRDGLDTEEVLNPKRLWDYV